jgi:hypothetical protein
MRTICACAAIAVLTAFMSSSSPSAALGLRIGPLYMGLPFGLRHRGRIAGEHRHRVALHPHAHERTATVDKTKPGGTEPAPGLAPDLGSALLYPGLAVPVIYDDIFSTAHISPHSSRWPFGYEPIFRAAFAKPAPDQDQSVCAPTDRPTAIVRHIKDEIDPDAAQSLLLAKLGNALGMAAGYLAKSCPKEIPEQPVARLQLMQLQIEVLSMALDIVRPPLQQFEQSLNGRQKARLAATPPAGGGTAQGCATPPSAINWSIGQIDQSVQPSDAQRQTLSGIEQTFRSAASDIDSHCPVTLPRTPFARLEAIQTGLDAEWRAVLAIQVALADFEAGLSDQQRLRFNTMDLAAAR